MAEFDHPELEARFTTIEEPTTRQVLRYDSLVDFRKGSQLYERLWTAAPELVEDWDTEIVDLDTNLDEAGTTDQLDIIKWAALAVFSFRQKLDEIPKN